MPDASSSHLNTRSCAVLHNTRQTLHVILRNFIVGHTRHVTRHTSQARVIQLGEGESSHCGGGLQ